MLEQTIRWLEMIGTVVDGLLLLRVLMLKLNRVYLFVTLFCALTLMFDVAAWRLGWDSQETLRMGVYSQYLFALVFPLVAWDVFEEVKTQTAKLRRARAPRLFSGVLLSLICGLIGAAIFEDKEINGTSSSIIFVALIVWIGSCTTSLLFVWFVYKGMKSQISEVPRNANTWSLYYLATLSLFMVDECIFSFFETSEPTKDVLRIILLVLSTLITAWCTIRLRAIPSDVASAPESVTS